MVDLGQVTVLYEPLEPGRLLSKCTESRMKTSDDSTFEREGGDEKQRTGLTMDDANQSLQPTANPLRGLVRG